MTTRKKNHRRIRLAIGLIVGLILGGAAGFALGVSINVDGGISQGSPRIYLVVTTIIAIAVVSIAIAAKRSAMGMNAGYARQNTAIRFVVLGLALLLAMGIAAFVLLSAQ